MEISRIDSSRDKLPRKLRILSISNALLVKSELPQSLEVFLFLAKSFRNLPRDSRIVQVTNDTRTDSILVYVASEHFSEIAETSEIPRIDASKLAEEILSP